MSTRALSPAAVPERLVSLWRTGLLDTPADPVFDRLTRLAARSLDAPVALITLVDSHREYCKSAFGSSLRFRAGTQGPLDSSICRLVVETGEPLLVRNASADDRVRDNPAVQAGRVTAYAGVPVHAADGEILGTLCVLDDRPRAWTPSEVETLEDLAALATEEIALRTEVLEHEHAEAQLERRVRERAAELVWANQALRSSEERYRALFDQVPVGVFYYDRELRITSCNEQFLRMANMPREELDGFDVSRLPDERVIPVFAPALEGEPSRYEGPYTTPTGLRMWISIRVAPLRDVDGSVVGGVGVVEDLTDAKQAEEERSELLHRETAARSEAEDATTRARFLAEASERFSASLDVDTIWQSLRGLLVPRLADFGLFYLLGDGGEVDRVELIHDRPGHEEMLRQIADRRPVGPPRLEPVLEALRTGRPVVVPALEDALSDPEHLRVVREMDIRSLLALPLRSHERTLGALCLGMGPSGRALDAAVVELAEEVARRAAVALDNAQLHAKVRSAMHAREQMLQVVSHDLRNPMATILLNASSLMETVPEERLSGWEREQLEWIAQACEQANRLIQDLLDVSRIEAGHLHVAPSPEDPTRLVRIATETMRPQALERRIVLRSEVAAGLGPVLADHDRTLQVLSNLLGNAVKFTPEGGSVQVHAGREGEELRFSVSDTGTGIAPEHLPHLFDRYWQAERRGRKGAGLGLAIARGIVEAQGGRMGVESTPGEGSTFWFTLPLPGDAPA